MKKLWVRVVHKTLHLQNMWSMIQSPEEQARAFTSRLIGTADLCDLSITCSKTGCTQKTSYRDEVVLQALLKGMHDTDIRTRVLSRMQNNELTKLADVVDYIAAEEASSASFSSIGTANTVAAQSAFKKLQLHLKPTAGNLPVEKYKHCGGRHAGDNSSSSRKLHCKAYGKVCTRCGKANHFATVCRSTALTSAPAATTDTSPTAMDNVTGAIMEPTVSSGLYACLSQPPNNQSYAAALKADGPVTTIPLPHFVHSIHEGLKKIQAQPSPIHPMEVKVDRAAYADLNIPGPCSSLRSRRIPNPQSCLDTGAQLTTVPVNILTYLGVKEQDLFPVLNNLNTVTGTAVDIIGGILLVFKGNNPLTGKARSTRQLAYVSRSIPHPHPFLSREACVDLGVIPSSFPAIGSCDYDRSSALAGGIENSVGKQEPHDPDKPCSNSGVCSPGDLLCSCPIRQLPPSSPPALPCSPTREDLPVIKQYILDRYAASTFNVCEHQPLPLMQGSPSLRLFMDEKAKPVAVHSPAPVPRHWAQQVQAGLDRDVRLGVIERVPVNVPVTWCSRMFTPPKHDGSPRRVVDFQEVNEHCPRQTHHTRSPWQIASSIPPNKCKTVLDAWHGYYSVSIHPYTSQLS